MRSSMVNALQINTASVRSNASFQWLLPRGHILLGRYRLLGCMENANNVAPSSGEDYSIRHLAVFRWHDYTTSLFSAVVSKDLW